MKVYIAAKDESYGTLQLIGVFSTVALAKAACESVDENIDPAKWWLDKPTIELWRNDDYYIDSCELDGTVVIIPPPASAWESE